MSEPERHRMRWTASELLALQRGIEEGSDTRVIAKELGRSAGAVQYKINMLHLRDDDEVASRQRRTSHFGGFSRDGESAYE